MKYKLLCLFLFLVIIARPMLFVYKNGEKFFSPWFPKQASSFEEAYYHSQYVKKENPGFIPDETLTVFMGDMFLKGINPIMLVHDHPPLGRYIVSLSIYFFHNPDTIIIPLTLLSVLGMFFIARLILPNALFSLIPIAIFVNEPLFLGKLIYPPVLESIQLPFIIFALYFFIRGISGKKYILWFVFTSIMLGFVIATRFFILGAVELFGMVLYFVFTKPIDRKRIFTFFLTLPLSLIVLMLSYLKTLQAGYSVLQIFGIQKYIFFYQQSKFINLFSFWDLLMFNRWHTWWADQRIISDDNWIIVWPLSVVVSTATYVLVAIKKKLHLSKPEKVVLLWIFVYSLLLSFGNTTTRYYLPLVPFIYILATAGILKCINLYYFKGKSRKK